MSDPNVRVVRAHYAAFDREDLDALVEGLTEDVVFGPGDPQAELEFGGPYVGRDEVRTWFEGIAGQFTGLSVEIATLEADGDDRVIASVYLHGTFRDSRMSGAVPVVHVFTIRDGLIAENRFYRQRDDV